jgi:hypothetical protein
MQTHIVPDPYPYRANGAPPEMRYRVRAIVRQPSFGKRELAATACVIALGDVAFANYGGVGQAIGLLAMPMVLLASAKHRVRSVRLIALLSFAALLALRSLYLPSVFVTFVGFAVIAAIAQAIRMPSLYVPEFLLSLIAVGLKLGRRIQAFARGVTKPLNLSSFWSKAATVLIPLILVSVFAGVLSLANPVVAEMIANALRWITFDLPSLWRVAIWIASFWAALMLLRPSLRRAFSWPENAEREQTARPFALALARNSLVGLNLLFLAYNITDAKHLVAFRPPPGMTTQDYAHQGAFWLTVALSMVNATIGFFFRDGLAVDPVAKRTRALGYGLLAQSFVLAGFTYQRMWIHVAHTGLSNLRIVGFLGASLVVFAMAMITYKLAKAKTFAFVLRRQLEAFATCTVVFALLPTHALSAHVNVQRIVQGELGPIVHLFAEAKSEESAALLAPLLTHPNDTVRHGVHALLLRETRELSAEVERNRGAGVLARDFASEDSAAKLQEALAEHQEPFPLCTKPSVRMLYPSTQEEWNQQCAIDALFHTTRENEYL